MTTYNYAEVHGHKMFYREAGDNSAPTIVLLHGFPTSSHMYRNLIPQLADTFHVIAPDYIGFGYSDAPNVAEFSYTFDNLATHVEGPLFGVLGLKQFSIYVQDYGAPVGYRIASKHLEAIEGTSCRTAMHTLQLQPRALRQMARVLPHQSNLAR
jgi:pimeloyl-ACP methyl ester carboxylesterase